MTDDPRKRGKADRIRINVSQGHERLYWSRALGITQLRLREIVKEVGPMVADVKAYLHKQIDNAGN